MKCSHKEGAALRKEPLRCIFCYAYRPGSAVDGGFSVNLYNDDSLSFTAFDARRCPVCEERFPLAKGTARQVLGLIAQADGWLRAFPPRMAALDRPVHIANIGVDGYPLFQMEDFNLLLQCEFRSTRGHYARLMYNLIEDISALLDARGFRLTLTSFGWDSARIAAQQAEAQARQEQAQRQDTGAERRRRFG